MRLLSLKYRNSLHKVALPAAMLLLHALLFATLPCFAQHQPSPLPYPPGDPRLEAWAREQGSQIAAYRNNSPEDLVEILTRIAARQLGVREDDPELQPYATAWMANLKNNAASRDSEAQPHANRRQLEISNHYKFDEGTEFSSAEEKPETGSAAPKWDSKLTERLGVLNAEYTSRMQQEYKMRSAGRLIPNCPKDYTDDSQCKDAGVTADMAHKKAEADIDMLFMRGEVPANSKELFGRRTQLRAYQGDENEPAPQSFGALGVPCLPFRMRLLNGCVYRYFGDDALKNYDPKENEKTNEKKDSNRATTQQK